MSISVHILLAGREAQGLGKVKTALALAECTDLSTQPILSQVDDEPLILTDTKLVRSVLFGYSELPVT